MGVRGQLLCALLIVAALATSDSNAVENLDDSSSVPVFSGLGLEGSLQNYDQARAEASEKNVINFAGPRYGNPGYKESHNWEASIDVFSPVVYDVQFYKAKYDDMKDKTTDQARADWKTRLQKDTVGQCRSGCLSFSLNMFAKGKPALTGKTCGEALEQFLQAGLFEGDVAGTTMMSFFTSKGVSEFVPEKGQSLGKMHAVADEYSWSFWYKSDAKPDLVVRNIMRYGSDDTKKEYPRSPAVFVVPKENNEWKECATEGQTCRFAGGAEVRYGAQGKYATKSLTGGTECTNQVFGDPVPGVQKKCEMKAGGASEWKDCAKEGEQCHFKGTTEVRYGANGKFATKRLSGTTGCNNGVFGDPVPGVVKRCAYKVGDVPTRLQFVVTQNNNADFGCTPETALELGKWYFVTLVVGDNTVTVLYDGVKQCAATNQGGRSIAPKAGGDVFASEPFSEPANGKIRALTFYPGMKLTALEIGLAMDKDRPAGERSATSAPPEAADAAPKEGDSSYI